MSKINILLALVIILELILLSIFIPNIIQLNSQCSLQRKNRDIFWDSFESNEINPGYIVTSAPNSTIELSMKYSYSGNQSLFIESHSTGENPGIEFLINWVLDPAYSSLANISFQFLPEKYYAFMILVIEDDLGRTIGIEYGNPDKFWTDDPTFISGDQVLYSNQNQIEWFSFNRNIQNEIERAFETEGAPFEKFTLSKVVSLLIATDPVPTALYIDDLQIIESYKDNTQLEIIMCTFEQATLNIKIVMILTVVIANTLFYLIKKMNKQRKSDVEIELYPIIKEN